MKKQKEFRNITIDILDTEGHTLSGIIPYNRRSEPIPFIEIITPNAFKKSLADGFNIKFLYEHREADLLGCLKNNSLQLENRADGLYFNVKLPKTTLAEDVWNLISEGYIQNVSFGMIVMRDTWTYEDGVEIRYLDEVKLLEISAVSEPAYPQTTVAARSLSQALDGKEIDDQAQESIKAEIEKLQSLLPKTEPEGPSIEEAKQEQARVEAELKAKVEAEIMQKKATEEELKAQEEAKAEAEEMQKLYERLEKAAEILCGETA